MASPLKDLYIANQLEDEVEETSSQGTQEHEVILRDNNSDSGQSGNNQCVDEGDTNCKSYAGFP